MNDGAPGVDFVRGMTRWFVYMQWRWVERLKHMTADI
jgi:hypothetical protein